MKRYITLAVFLLLPVIGLAQGTTSGTIEGSILDENREPLPAANIIAIHEPTGSRYGTSSRADGRYTLKNIKVGGPYVIQVTFLGYNPQKKEITNIELNETVELNFQLTEGGLSLDQIAVVAQPDPVFNANRTGASTNISRSDIESTPTISRSLQDFTRLNPQVTSGYSFGGANNRYNNILVDGATLNDIFGLGDAIPGSQAGVSSPLSIDAIEEFNVDLAPFDVTNNGFTGGQINAITKSGTNRYSSSVYYQMRNESFVGNYQFPRAGQTITSSDYPTFQESYLGLNVSGPIITDKLFFFVNGEFRRQSSPVTTGILGSGAANEHALGASTFDQIRTIAMNQYGYDPGSYSSPFTASQNNNKLLAKLDWNINDMNKFTFRYNYVDAADEEGVYRDSDEYSYGNRQYDFNSNQSSFVAQLKSNLSDNVFNEARIVYTRIRDSRDVVAQRFPQVELSLPNGSGGFASIFMGIDRFSQANSLDQDLIEVTNNLSFITGSHEFTVGTSNQLYGFNNLFVQDSYGAYEFRSIEDWENGDPYAYYYSYLLPEGKPMAEFSGLQFGLYAQDKMSIGNNLKLTLGLRADIPILPDSPTFNPLVPEDFPGYTTDRVASGNVLWSPRLGFNWDASAGMRTTQIRGGVGIFSGNPPFVWISNQYSNTGADYGRIDLSGSRLPDSFRFEEDPDQQRSDLTGVTTSEINLIAEDFKYPQSLKFNLAVDQELPGGIAATVEGIYSRMLNEVTFRNINLEQVGTSIYGRPMYGDLVFSERFGNTSGTPARISDNFTNALVLDNTNQGYQLSLTGRLQKQFDNGLSSSLSYTFNRAETINNGSSSRAISNWQYNENVDVNSPELGTADYERRHRVLAQLAYRFDWNDRLATTISLIYDGRAGAPYSWIYSGDANGDGRFDNDLVYVPETEEDIVLTSNNWNEFDRFISDNSSLDNFRGGHVERGTAREPWTNFLDLRVNQAIQTFGGQQLELTASLFNVLNLLNRDWGVQKSVNGFNNYQLLAFQGYVDQDFINDNPQYGLGSADMGKPIMNYDPVNVTDDELNSISDLSSRWQLQLGIRYSF